MNLGFFMMPGSTYNIEQNAGSTSAKGEYQQAFTNAMASSITKAAAAQAIVPAVGNLSTMMTAQGPLINAEGAGTSTPNSLSQLPSAAGSTQAIVGDNTLPPGWPGTPSERQFATVTGWPMYSRGKRVAIIGGGLALLAALTGGIVWAVRRRG